MPLPNTILQGCYRIVRELGRGGMGTVYEAVDQRLNCRVALKEMLGPHDDESRKAFERRKREAQVAEQARARDEERRRAQEREPLREDEARRQAGSLAMTPAPTVRSHEFSSDNTAEINAHIERNSSVELL